MCGIITVVNNSGQDETPISSLLNLLAHRGPDDHGWLTWDGSTCKFGRDQATVRGKVVMGHRRLSILDLSENGREPMVSADGRLYITYNGEVYNYRELRTELELLGHDFRTRTDTEVVLAAVSQWGYDAVRRFKGMFAFTVLDIQHRKLYAVRDHFGIKPLYYCRFRNGIAFASEISPLLELPGVSRETNAQAVYDYLQFGLTSHTSSTLFSAINQLPPASLLEIDVDTPGNCAVSSYWQIQAEQNDFGGYEAATVRVRDLFLENIKLHLRSDVPLGSALSGGIDSSAIVCAIREVAPSTDIHTFSYVAPGSLSEEKWMDMINERVGAKAVKVAPDSNELSGDISDLIRAQGEPFGSTSIYAQYCVFRAAAANGIKVMLDGQGADEMLAGYVGYQGSYLASLIKQKRLIRALGFMRNSSRWPGRSATKVAQLAARQVLPVGLQVLGRRMIGKTLTPSWMNLDWFRERDVQFVPPLIKSEGHHCLRASLVDALQRTSLPALLRYEDRNSMRFSIESRVPFLTYDFAELVLSLPEEYLIDATGRSKCIFRDAMRGIVPDEVLDRKDKIGFSTPEASWLRDNDKFLDDVVANVSNMKMLDERESRHLLGSDPENRKFSNGQYVWRAANLIRWAEIFSTTS